MEEKQIVEMANIERLLRVRKLDIEKQGFDVASIFYGKESEEASVARYLVQEGYRKASDVAREIFAEIEEIAIEHEMFGRTVLIIGQGTLAELKKKYER